MPSAESDWLTFGAAIVAGFGGGAMNAIAGGGTNLLFPVLVWIGITPVRADATNMFALFPAAIGGVWGYRRELKKVPCWWFWLAIPGVIGGTIGAFLLATLPADWFERIAPWMVLGSALLLGLEPYLKKALHIGRRTDPSFRWRLVAVVVLLVISLYGGYFGSGLGLLLLTSIGLLGIADIQKANALKNLLMIGIQGAAVVYFVIQQMVVWQYAAAAAASAIVGGFVGAGIARRFGGRKLRYGVVAVGVLMAGWMFIRLG